MQTNSWAARAAGLVAILVLIVSFSAESILKVFKGWIFSVQDAIIENHLSADWIFFTFMAAAFPIVCLMTVFWNAASAHNYRVQRFFQALTIANRKSYSEECSQSDDGTEAQEHGVDVEERVKVLLVIAHPDDEAMFFGPTLKNLREKNSIFDTWILCLSNGNAEGLGAIREKELLASTTSVFGIPPEQVTIVNDKKLQDGDFSWPDSIVHSYVKNFVESAKIDIVLTFDEAGVSRHPNHISTFKGVERYHTELLEECHSKSNAFDKNDFKKPKVAFFKLISEANIIRKYCGFFCIIPTTVQVRGNNWDALVSLSFLPSFRGMCAHRSQFLWYRLLFVIFSSYSYTNVYQPLI